MSRNRPSRLPSTVRARLSVELFEDRVPVSESVGTGLTLRALAGAAEIRLLRSPTVASHIALSESAAGSPASPTHASQAIGLHDPRTVSVVNRAPASAVDVTAAESLFTIGLDSGLFDSLGASSVSRPALDPQSGSGAPSSSPGVQTAGTAGVPNSGHTTAGTGASQTTFSFQPADPGAALWQAVNAFASGAGISRTRAGTGPGATPAAGPALSSPAASGPALGGPAQTPAAGTAVLSSSDPIQGSPPPGYPGGPYVSTSLPPGGIVPEAVSSQLVDVVRVATGAESNIPSLFSPSGVRYADGAVNLVFGDLSSGGFGTDWGVTRTWTNLTNTANGFSGTVPLPELPAAFSPELTR